MNIHGDGWVRAEVGEGMNEAEIQMWFSFTLLNGCMNGECGLTVDFLPHIERELTWSI